MLCGIVVPTLVSAMPYSAINPFQSVSHRHGILLPSVVKKFGGVCRAMPPNLEGADRHTSRAESSAPNEDLVHIGVGMGVASGQHVYLYFQPH